MRLHSLFFHISIEYIRKMKRYQIDYNKRKIIHLPSFQGDIYEVNSTTIYDPYDIVSLQQYNPIYSLYFDLNKNNYNNIALNHVNHIIGPNEIFNTKTNKNEKKKIFTKFAPLLDPIRFMIDK